MSKFCKIILGLILVVVLTSCDSLRQEVSKLLDSQYKKMEEKHTMEYASINWPDNLLKLDLVRWYAEVPDLSRRTAMVANNQYQSHVISPQSIHQSFRFLCSSFPQIFERSINLYSDRRYYESTEWLLKLRTCNPNFDSTCWTFFEGVLAHVSPNDDGNVLTIYPMVPSKRIVVKNICKQ